MTAIFLNIVFAVLGVLVAVGIPLAGLAWQRAERNYRAETARDTSAQRIPAGVAGYRESNAPVPNSWANQEELQNANDRVVARS